MFKCQNVQMVGRKLNKYDNLHPLEVVGRGSGAQLQVGENLFFYCSGSGVNIGPNTLVHFMLIIIK